ncbi:hypothetical protein U732_1101 [Clostridium argentinense CDC 2741]|uniref:Uncharacterized protein n=1 Tax=Clostridium argentinense CDC 2741 TaxID=1418104 RepID=A0A0C1R0W0_9CLOT|nr:hypothetical protein [Clostridium argentinense]ARC85660.1 hypothetical protein RSJ17_14665 [Clostridium argentinense]KIE46997.1 hypothetical protein U732_1101 [Clostridium argentinense CDC 2741]NFF40817.1 hypothetical protein [Clostridium argentinense]NFP50749.1 hypothetical protein [Clostridium argentinense]NFP73094.1 hypothetical protein [Clostridium argentinense]
MSGYILLDETNGGGYYLGKKYIFQGCQYPCFANSKEKAKVYKSEKVANKVAEELNWECGARYEFGVLEVD